MSTRTVDNPKVVSRKEWLVARKKLLAKEKQLTRQRDAIAAGNGWTRVVFAGLTNPPGMRCGRNGTTGPGNQRGSRQEFIRTF